MLLSRRAVIFGLPLMMGGCAANQPSMELAQIFSADPYYASMYGEVKGEPFPVPAVDLRRVKPQYLRRQVTYATGEPPGTIIVDTNTRFLYLLQEGGKALRYGVGVGKMAAFNFRGAATIARKAKWPGWRPTPAMIAREPDRYGPVKDGLPGGSGNPLGPRALYLYRNGKDTLYRLHGTLEPWTIGTQVSSGCIRLLNQDIIDLYRRVPIGTKVVILPATPAAV